MNPRPRNCTYHCAKFTLTSQFTKTKTTKIFNKKISLLSLKVYLSLSLSLPPSLPQSLSLSLSHIHNTLRERERERERERLSEAIIYSFLFISYMSLIGISLTDVTKKTSFSHSLPFSIIFCFYLCPFLLNISRILSYILSIHSSFSI